MRKKIALCLIILCVLMSCVGCFSKMTPKQEETDRIIHADVSTLTLDEIEYAIDHSFNIVKGTESHNKRVYWLTKILVYEREKEIRLLGLGEGEE